MIRTKLTNEGLAKKKFTKLGLEFLRNLEMLCFINIDKIEEFKKIILNKLNEYQGYTKFKNYIKNYLFKINPKIYNFSELIDYFNKHNINKFIDKIHTTNNICECINSKLSYYLPKENTKNINFINSITKVIINDEFLIKNEIRHDFITKTFIYLIEKIDFNKNLNWINYSDFKDCCFKIMNNKINDKNEVTVNNIINFIDNLEHNNIIDKNNSDEEIEKNININNERNLNDNRDEIQY